MTSSRDNGYCLIVAKRLKNGIFWSQFVGQGRKKVQTYRIFPGLPRGYDFCLWPAESPAGDPPLTLAMTLYDGSQNSCDPIQGAKVDIWHCDAQGHHSGVSDPGFDTSGQKFLRGYQLTDSSGRAQFTTTYPGWYAGRAYPFQDPLDRAR